MKILIRTDGGTTTGTGHVMRCIALAEAARAEGHDVTFVTAPPNPLEGRIRQTGSDLHPLSSSPGGAADARDTRAMADELSADWIVLDGYGFDGAYQKELGVGAARLLLVDDYGHGSPYAAHLILNQNSYAPGNARWYDDRPGRCQLLLGADYAMLRREFAAAERRTPTDAPARSLLVTLGGSDPDNVTGRVLEALDALPASGPDVTVALGSANPHAAAVRKAVMGKRIVIDAGMPALMEAADVAVSAAGTTAYELAYMGIPSLLLAIAGNQALVADDMRERGIALALGQDALTPVAMAAELKKLLGDGRLRKRLSQKGRAFVDGKGAERVVRAMAAYR